MSQLMRRYTLIISEKPAVAKKIAQALDKMGKPKCLSKNGVPYFIAQRETKLVVVPAIGHLYTIVNRNGKNNQYPVFNFSWAPRHLAERGAKKIRNWIETFSEISKDADHFISACDYDIEGCLIGYCILEYACGNKAVLARRMKFSTLVKSDLEKAYEKSLPHLDFELIEAGKTRHEVDWLYGVNLSRALTLAAYLGSGKYSLLSTGRVQGSTLQFLAFRERSIRSFVPVPFWEIRANAEIGDCVVDAEYERKKIETREEAEAIIHACKDRTGRILKIEIKRFHQKSPIPFDFGKLQHEAYRLFGYTPRKTSFIAQQLYLKALISYPRTSSQKLPPIINYRKILSALTEKPAYKYLASKILETEILKPREGTKIDHAHPAIFPTGNLPEKHLSISEKSLWDLIVRRFMALFGKDALKESMKVILEVNNHCFFLKGNRIIDDGWIEYYKPYFRAKERFLPIVKEGDSVRIQLIVCEDKYTKPPPRYNPSSLLEKMESCGIGTKATRADIIQTLYNRNYIVDSRIVMTELGFNIINVLDQYAPLVVSVQLTQELENKLEEIKKSKNNRKSVLKEVIKQLEPQLKKFKENEVAIGEVLGKATKQALMQERTIGECPNCGTGKLVIVHSRATKKRFIGCTNYYKGLCRTSFPLPQQGTIKSAGSKCKTCEWPIVLVWIRRRKPWNLCFNPNCSTKKRRKKI